MTARSTIIAMTAAIGAVAGGVTPALASSPPGLPPAPVIRDYSRAPGNGLLCAPPLAAVVTAPFRIYDDSWGTRTCVRVRGNSFRVETNARPDGGEVVAYPDIQFGSAYGYTTPGSGLPRPVRKVRYHPEWVTGTAGGSARGAWIADFDSWFFPSRNVTGHGTAEMVIVLRYPRGSMSGGQLVTIGGRRWWVREWITCEHAPHGPCLRSWPLIRFAAARRVRHARIRFGSFVNLAVHRGMLPKSDWWGSLSFGFENWSGGRGETASLRVQR